MESYNEGDANPNLGILGTLRSELDDANDLHRVFVSMQLAHSTVVIAYGERRLSGHAAAMILKELKIKGSDGNYWTLGASTKSWYKREYENEGPWQLAPEPEGIILEGESPFWCIKGVGSLINEVTQLESSESAKEVVEEELDELSQQERDSAEIDWIFDEWGKDVEVAELETPKNIVGSLGLPEEIPGNWDSDVSMINAINAVGTYPSDRESSKLLDALDDQEIEFFESSNYEDLGNLENYDPNLEVSEVAPPSRVEDYFVPYTEDDEDSLDTSASKSNLDAISKSTSRIAEENTQIGSRETDITSILANNNSKNEDGGELNPSQSVTNIYEDLLIPPTESTKLTPLVNLDNTYKNVAKAPMPDSPEGGNSYVNEQLEQSPYMLDEEASVSYHEGAIEFKTTQPFKDAESSSSYVDDTD